MEKLELTDGGNQRSFFFFLSALCRLLFCLSSGWADHFQNNIERIKTQNAFTFVCCIIFIHFTIGRIGIHFNGKRKSARKKEKEHEFFFLVYLFLSTSFCPFNCRQIRHTAHKGQKQKLSYYWQSYQWRWRRQQQRQEWAMIMKFIYEVKSRAT